MSKNLSNSINGYLTNGILFNAKLIKSYESRSLVVGNVTEADPPIQ
jgi:ribosomal protein S17E